MKKIIISVLLVLISLYSSSQKKCQLKSLSQESKSGLIKFWDSFRESVTKKDTATLLSLCEFPFRVTAEILSNKREVGENYMLDSTNIIMYANLIFFEKQFEESLSISLNPIENLKLHGNLNKKHRTCLYEYFYLVKDKEQKNQLRSFSIVKIDSSYKLVSNWIRY